MKTLDGLFLGNLTEQQKGLLWEYYRLLTKPLQSFEDEAEQICKIWTYAEEDSTLRKWLELIDYFYTDGVEEDEVFSEDRRAYLSEYIGVLAESQLNKEGTNNDDVLHGGTIAFLTCPDGSGYVSLIKNSKDASELENLKQQVCKQCGFRVDEHKIILLGRTAPYS